MKLSCHGLKPSQKDSLKVIRDKKMSNDAHNAHKHLLISSELRGVDMQGGVIGIYGCL
jgi:hypothetical protein